MNKRAAAVTAQFTITDDGGSGGAVAPKIAFAEDLNKYLVVWIAFPAGGPTITGRFLGSGKNPIGNSFKIFTDAGGASYLYPHSYLRYNSKTQKFAVTWEYRTPELNVAFITVDSSGTPGPFKQITNVGSNGSPALAVNDVTGDYCIAYKKFVPLSFTEWETQINVVKIDPSTGAVSPETTVFSVNQTGQAGQPGIVYNSVEGRYMVSWDANLAIGVQGKILDSCNGGDGRRIRRLELPCRSPYARLQFEIQYLRNRRTRRAG